MKEKKIPSTSQLLDGLSKRAERKTQFMASLIARYRTQEKLSDTDLALHLNASRAQVIRLSLCKCPDAHSPDFPKQISQIATYSGIELERIVRIIRQVEGLESLAQLNWGQEAIQESHDLETKQRQYSVLAAARDRLESEEEDEVHDGHEESNDAEESENQKQ